MLLLYLYRHWIFQCPFCVLIIQEHSNLLGVTFHFLLQWPFRRLFLSKMSHWWKFYCAHQVTWMPRATTQWMPNSNCRERYREFVVCNKCPLFGLRWHSRDIYKRHINLLVDFNSFARWAVLMAAQLWVDLIYRKQRDNKICLYLLRLFVW